MEFTDVSLSDYEKRPSLYTIASCISRKEIVTEEDSFTLVAVAVCGGNYTVEWASNLTVGTGERHEGFNTAAELVENRIMGYLAREGLIGKKVKLWISGFSRAAAVANITAADITSMNLIPASDIFSYNFTTPRMTWGTQEIMKTFSISSGNRTPSHGLRRLTGDLSDTEGTCIRQARRQTQTILNVRPGWKLFLRI